MLHAGMGRRHPVEQATKPVPEKLRPIGVHYKAGACAVLAPVEQATKPVQENLPPIHY